jgi:hypothetical protein
MGTRIQQAASRELILADASEHLRSALQLLDLADAPAQIGAQVDLALHQLESELLHSDRPGTSGGSPARH